MSDKNKSDEEQQQSQEQQQGGIGHAGSEGTEAHNNNNEGKPISQPPLTPSGPEAEKEASENS